VGCGKATPIAGSNDTPRGLGCRYVNRKAESAPLKHAKPRGFLLASGFVHAAINDRRAGHPLALYMRQSELFFKPEDRIQEFWTGPKRRV
jgi:hypothetical protein